MKRRLSETGAGLYHIKVNKGKYAIPRSILENLPPREPPAIGWNPGRGTRESGRQKGG